MYRINKKYNHAKRVTGGEIFPVNCAYVKSNALIFPSVLL